RTDLLRAAIEKDKKEGRIPCCIVGMAGSTSTGVIDPLEELAEIARENNCWFHADAAYGGGLAFSEKHAHKLRGIDAANSITFDQHIELTEYLASRLDELKDFERVGEIETAVCCFRFLPEEVRALSYAEQDRVQQLLQQRIEKSGKAFFPSTILHGRRALRV